jgi:hypothetical protein
MMSALASTTHSGEVQMVNNAVASEHSTIAAGGQRQQVRQRIITLKRHTRAYLEQTIASVP